MKQKTFAIIGLGFISERHIRAINSVGGKLIAASDIDVEKKHKLPEGCKFEKNWQKLRQYKPDYVVICTPNHLHYDMSKYFSESEIICEKPLVINPVQCDFLGENVNEVKQLRYDEELINLKNKINSKSFYRVEMEIAVSRGEWYWKSWKGKIEESGGLLFNIGVHYFDLLNWFFDKPITVKNVEVEKKKASGVLNFKNARVKWSLRLNAPVDNQVRKIIINNKPVNLNRNFEYLHNLVYKNILDGNGIKPSSSKDTLQLIKKIYESTGNTQR